MSETVTNFAKLFEALAKAQGEIQGAGKDSKNPFFNSNYADLSSVWNVCRGPLSRNGLSIIQHPTTHIVDGKLSVTIGTWLCHSSGDSIESSLTMWPAKTDPQAIGSCISYLRRYALAAIVGIYQVDDDGEAAMPKGTKKETSNKDVLVQSCIDGAKDLIKDMKEDEAKKFMQKYFECASFRDFSRKSDEKLEENLKIRVKRHE
jgi:hypothetical protein